MSKASCRRSCWGLLILAAVLGGSPAFGDLATFQGLGVPSGYTDTGAYGVSEDGSVVVGFAGATGGGKAAVRWTLGGGIQFLSSVGDGNAAFAASVDGSVIVGQNNYHPFRWTETGGMVDLGTLTATSRGVSADGSVVVGNGWSYAGSYGFLWTSTDGFQTVPTSWDGAFGVSADGSVVVGQTQSCQAFRWTEVGGTVELPHLPGDSGSAAYGVSADGLVVVGYSGGPSSTACLWNGDPVSGVVAIGGQTIRSNAMFGVSADGSLVVGEAKSDYEPFIWDSTHGTQSLSDWFAANGLNPYADGWSYMSVTDISDDGRTIVGWGNHNGGEAWVVKLDGTNVVPVPGAALLSLLGIACAGWRLRRQAR